MMATNGSKGWDQGLLGQEQFAVRVFVMVCITPIVIFIIVGNILYMVAVYRNRHLRIPRNLIIVSLALCGVLDAIFGIPVYAYANVFYYEIFRMSTDGIAYLIPMLALSGVSLLHVIMLTVDRYLAVMKPLRYVTIITSKRICIALGSLWIFGILFFAGVSIAMTLQPVSSQDEGDDVSSSQTPVNEAISLTIHWSSFLTMMLVMVVLLGVNVLILRIAMKQANAIANQRVAIHLQEEQQPQVQEDRLKAVKTVSLVVFITVLFWFPFPLYPILSLTTYFSYFTLYVYNNCILVLHAISLVVNLITYGFKDRRFREAFGDIFRGLKGR